jgi:hypothetical protein
MYYYNEFTLFKGKIYECNHCFVDPSPIHFNGV